MKNTIQLYTTINLLTPDKIYASDKQKIVLAELEKKYVNRCHKSMLITKIVEIIQISDIVMAKSSLDGSAYVDVQFKVEGYIYTNGEILHNVELQTFFDDVILGKHEHAGVSINIKKFGNKIVFKPGDLIHVKVIDARYPIHRNAISVIGEIWKPEAEPQITFYKITDGLTKEQSRKIKEMFEYIKIDEERNNALKKEKQYGFFTELMYPYKTKQKIEKIDIIARNNFKSIKLNFDALSKINHGTIVYSDLDDRSSGQLFYSEQKIESTNVIYCSLNTVLVKVLLTYKKYLDAIHGFVTTYDTPAKLQKMGAYWVLCRNAKA